MNNEQAKPSSTRPRPWLLVSAALAVLGALGQQLLAPTNRDGATQESTQPLQMSALLQAGSCRAADSADLQAHARKLESVAQARMERSVFVPADGPRAALLLSEAQLCFAQANRTSDAARTQGLWQQWQQELSSRFQGHRLRLQLALRAKQTARALEEIADLQALIAGLPQDGDPQLSKFSHGLDVEQRRLRAVSKKKG